MGQVLQDRKPLYGQTRWLKQVDHLRRPRFVSTMRPARLSGGSIARAAAKGGSMSTREIGAGNRAFVDAAVRHDLDAIASLFTADAIALPPDGEIAKGRDAIRQLWK